MLKLQIGENFVSLTTKEEDLFFELLDQNYNTIRNSPTFNAIYNWMKEDETDLLSVDQQVLQNQLEEFIEDPWTSEKTKSKLTEDYTALGKLLANLLSGDKENGYYIAM